MKAVAVTSAEELAAAAGLLLVTGVPWLLFGRQSWRKMNRERLGRQRARVAERAVVEASLDDEAFSPELLLGTVREILDLAQRVWEDDALDEVARPDGRLILSWADSVARAFGRGVRRVGDPVVDVLHVVNRPGELEDRVMLRVRQRLTRSQRPTLADPRIVVVDQRWTLGHTGRQWTLRSIEADPLAGALLETRLIPDEEADEDRLFEQSLAELARADRQQQQIDLDALMPVGVPGGKRLLELSQLDGRFDVALLEAVLRHIIDAWQEASTGSSTPLRELSTHGAVRGVRRPVPNEPACVLMVKDLRLDHWAVRAVDPARQPPQVKIALKVTAVRYLINASPGAVSPAVMRSPMPSSFYGRYNSL